MGAQSYTFRSMSFDKCCEAMHTLVSTAVRVALLTAGFFVAEGVGMGPKSSTTIAFTKSSGVAGHPLAPPLLGQDWLARWKRSHSKFPGGIADENKPAFEKRFEAHPQFTAYAVRPY
jgi:queuine tRNA-ribosyltransferase